MKKNQIIDLVKYQDFKNKLDLTNIPEERHQLISIFLYKNNQINLSAIRDPWWVYNKHILDALQLLEVLSYEDLSNKTICDIGTWWWFPLLPLAIKLPDTKLIWVDSIQKKLTAIEDMMWFLWLENCTFEWSRIEDLRFENWLPDIYTARAVSYIDNLLAWTKSLLKNWNKLVLYKLYTKEEYDLMISLLSSYQLKIIHEHHYHLWDEIDRVIYILQKY